MMSIKSNHESCHYVHHLPINKFFWLWFISETALSEQNWFRGDALVGVPCMVNMQTGGIIHMYEFEGTYWVVIGKSEPPSVTKQREASSAKMWSRLDARNWQNKRHPMKILK